MKRRTERKRRAIGDEVCFLFTRLFVDGASSVGASSRCRAIASRHGDPLRPNSVQATDVRVHGRSSRACSGSSRHDVGARVASERHLAARNVTPGVREPGPSFVRILARALFNVDP